MVVGATISAGVAAAVEVVAGEDCAGGDAEAVATGTLAEGEADAAGATEAAVAATVELVAGEACGGGDAEAGAAATLAEGEVDAAGATEAAALVSADALAAGVPTGVVGTGLLATAGVGEPAGAEFFVVAAAAALCSWRAGRLPTFARSGPVRI